jgi:hypothetical protein
VVRTKRDWLFFGQLALGAPILLMPWFVQSPETYFRISPPLLAVALLVGQAWQRWLRARTLSVRADATGVYLGGRLATTRAAILRAHVIRDRGTNLVRLVRRFRPFEIVVDDEEEGERLIAALCLDPAHSVVRVTVSDGTLRRVLVRTAVVSVAWLTGVVTSAKLFASAGAAGYLAGASALVGCAVLFARGQLTLSVGADGVHIRRWLGRARFVGYPEIMHVTINGPTLSLELRGGSALWMSLGVGAQVGWLVGREPQDEADALFSRIAANVEHHRARERAMNIHAPLSRGARPTEQWLRALRVSSETSATWRVAAIPEEVLWNVVEDTTAPATSRVGAAVALRPTLDRASMARLRVAAQACAAPRVRTALEAAASAEDESELTAALDAFDDNPDNLPWRPLENES